MSPAPTRTGSLPSAVWNVQIELVTVVAPSLAVTYHWYRWPSSRPDHVVLVDAPEATPVFVVMSVKTPLADVRP